MRFPPLAPNPFPLKRGEGSKHKDVGKDEAIALSVPPCLLG